MFGRSSTTKPCRVNKWHFRAWRKSFPERFGISAHGESRFPKGLAFPRTAKVVSRVVWHFRARRKSFPEWFGISAHGESCFPKGLRLSPRGGKYFPKRLKRERIVYLRRNKNGSLISVLVLLFLHLILLEYMV